MNGNNGIAGWLNSPASVAAARGVIGAALIGLMTWLTTDQVAQSLTNEQSLKLAAASAVGTLIWRFGFEGMYDQHRNATGNVKPGDVGQ